MVLVSDESWVSPLGAYLRSELVHRWLDHHTERRGEKWVINEQVLKWIPTSKRLLTALGISFNGPLSEPHSLAPPLPLEWEKRISPLHFNPRDIKEALTRLPSNPSSSPDGMSLFLQIHCTVFIQAARVLDELQFGQQRLFSLVNPDGRVRWIELLNILPKGECVPISLHPKIQLTGSLPPHLPIGKIDRFKSPTPGILLATESGFSLRITSDAPLLIQLLWEQLNGVNHPTWSELLHYLKIPRRIELAESTALEILRSHGEQSVKLTDLQDLLANCQLF
jgi:hypothetical protein